MLQCCALSNTITVCVCLMKFGRMSVLRCRCKLLIALLYSQFCCFVLFFLVQCSEIMTTFIYLKFIKLLKFGRMSVLRCRCKLLIALLYSQFCCFVLFFLVQCSEIMTTFIFASKKKQKSCAMALFYCRDVQMV